MAKKTGELLERLRNRDWLTRSEKLHLIALLSIPSVLAQVTSTLLFFIDASMVGSLGAEASASVGIVETSTWLFGSMTGAAAMGFSVQVAHLIGANDFVGARAVCRQAIMLAFCFALIVSAIGLAISPFLPYWLGGGADIAPMASMYFAIFVGVLPFYQIYNLSASMLKCAGNMKVASIMSVVMCVLDALFNFLFIFPVRQVDTMLGTVTIPGLGLGVPGAALGTNLAILTCCIAIAWFAFFRSDMLRLNQEAGRWRPTRPVVEKAVSISLPMAGQYIMMNGAQIVSTLIIAPLGNIAIAAHSFAITAESLCYMPGYGIGEAATTLVGQSLGAGKKGMARVFAKLSVTSGMSVMALMGLIMYVFAPEMISVMSPVEGIRTLGADVLRIEAWAEPMFAAAIVCYACFVGAGDTFKPACINLATMWGIRLTLAALFAPMYGLRGVWVAMAIELSARGMLMLYRLFFGHWIKEKSISN